MIHKIKAITKIKSITVQTSIKTIKIMKIERVLTTVFLLALAFWLLKKTACHGCYNFGSGIKGSGHVITEDRPVGDFTEIEATAVIDIILRQGDAASVKIEADDNLMQNIKTDVSHGRLEISMPKNFRLGGNSTIKAYITIKNLEELEVTGVSQVTCESQLALDRFKLNFTGVGGCSLRGTCNDAELRNTGVGDVDALDFVCKNLSVKNSGTGDVKCRADNELMIQNSGVGDVEYTGSAVIKEVSSTGVGKVKKI